MVVGRGRDGKVNAITRLRSCRLSVASCQQTGVPRGALPPSAFIIQNSAFLPALCLIVLSVRASVVFDGYWRMKIGCVSRLTGKVRESADDDGMAFGRNMLESRSKSVKVGHLC